MTSSHSEGLYQMNCIESLLWGEQNKNHPQKVSATEFGAYILLDAKQTTVKVYLQTGRSKQTTPLSNQESARGH